MSKVDYWNIVTFRFSAAQHFSSPLQSSIDGSNIEKCECRSGASLILARIVLMVVNTVRWKTNLCLARGFRLECERNTHRQYRTFSLLHKFPLKAVLILKRQFCLLTDFWCIFVMNLHLWRSRLKLHTCSQDKTHKPQSS